MKISIVRALDHYRCTKRANLKPTLVEGIGEIIEEDDSILILRSFRSFDEDLPNEDPDEEFTGLVKAAIIHRIDLEVDLEKGIFVGQIHKEVESNGETDRTT